MKTSSSFSAPWLTPAILPSIMLLAGGCVIPTVSLHTTRETAITATDVEFGKPIAKAPIEVDYGYDVFTPLFIHIELNKPANLKAETDNAGKALIPIADYSGWMQFRVGSNAYFNLDKNTLRHGGVVKSLNAKVQLDLKPAPAPPKQQSPRDAEATRLAGHNRPMN